jgi:hypothetical protein
LSAKWIASIVVTLLIALVILLFNENLKELLKTLGWNALFVKYWKRWRSRLHLANLRGLWWLWLCSGLLVGGVGVGVGFLLFGLNPPPAKSTFLTLDDGQKWRFSEALRNSANAQNGERISCEFALGLSRTVQSEFNFVWGVWTELQPMLDLAGWRHASAGDLGLGQRQFPPGFTLLAGGEQGPGVICAAALGRVLQDTLRTDTPVTVRTKQVTEALIGCKNNCVELDIGDFHVN